MRAKLLTDTPRTFALIFDKDDDVTKSLLEFAKQHQLKATYFAGIGAFSDLTLGFFERDRKDYKRIEVNEQVEVMSLVGNIATDERGEYKLHAHVVIGKADGTAHGGHLMQARVWPTLELFMTETAGELIRRVDEETNLPLIAIMREP